MRAVRWVAAVSVVTAAFVAVRNPTRVTSAAWGRAVAPGVVSSAHALLADDCAACHTPTQGATADKCAACHADSRVVRREPTAFHAAAGACRGCHPEHRGSAVRPTQMDHAVLARIGVGTPTGTGTGVGSDPARGRLRRWLAEGGDGPHPGITRPEAALDCAACHGTKDRHRGLFGKDCAQCHRTDLWTLPEFRHPSPRSTECAECHQAPPSHYMEHFQMVSATAARQPYATVRECFHCHQTTAWNDIAGVGWYKHH